MFNFISYKKSIFILLGINFALGLRGIGQSFDIHFSKVIRGERYLNHDFDIPAHTQYEFSAVSVRLEGKNVSRHIQNALLKTSSESFALPRFHEADQDNDIFISQIIYLAPENTGQLSLIIEGLDNLSGDTLQGYIRIFRPKPDSSKHEKPQVGSFTEASDDSCVCPQPPYMPRSQWGLSFGLSPDIYIPPATYTQVTHMIVHHSAGTHTSQNWPAVVASIFDFHVNTNKWQDIGYNWLIDPNGNIYEGRGGGDNVRGAHMCGYNNNTTGICLLGNFEMHEPTEEAVSALEKLMSWKTCLESIDPEGQSDIVSHYGRMNNISGHQEGCRPSHTACPGQFLFRKLALIRKSTHDYRKTECDIISSLEENLYNNALSVYPNPTRNQVCITGEYFTHITLRDVLGRDFRFPLDGNCVDISFLEPGIYMMTTDDEAQKDRKIILKL